MRSSYKFVLLILIALVGLTLLVPRTFNPTANPKPEHGNQVARAAIQAVRNNAVGASSRAQAAVTLVNSVGQCPASFTVTSLSDFGDSTPGDGICTGCTLRAAIEEANALPACAPLTINFNLTGTIVLAGPLPALDHPNLTITGPTNGTLNAPGITVQRFTGGSDYSVFVINANRTVTLNNLTISNGYAAEGGGIRNNGDLTLTNCALTFNWASTGGGGLYDAGTARLSNCTISRNSAPSGAGILAIGTPSSGATTIASSTIARNTAMGPGGGLQISGSHSITLRNTIIADNEGTVGPDVRNPDSLISQGNNLIGKTDGSAGWIASDKTGTVAAPLDARLAVFAVNNGGPTPTHALLCDSPAIDAGNTALAPATDQRGLPRPADGDGNGTNVADIGALEVQKYTVTTTADSGAGSLRQAIIDNNTAGNGLIVFNIPGAGVQTITPLSTLPFLTKPVNLDGYSQPGARPNTLATGSDAVLLIELSGVNAVAPPGSFVDGLHLTASNCCVRGLVINSFSGYGITLELLARNNWINGNYIGTNAVGTAALGNHFSGLFIFNFGVSNNLIGGRTPGARNLISGNGGPSISISADPGGTTANRVEGNYIGTNAQGTAALGNRGDGVQIVGAGENIIGGAAPGAGNLIAFNGGAGVGIFNIDLFPFSNAVLGNSIFDNSALGIDLYSTPTNGVTPNDTGDGDTGPNGLQNFPVLTSASSDGSSTTIAGTLNSTANRTFTIQFFANIDCDSSGHGEGRFYLGQTSVMTDDSGNAPINTTLSAVVAGGSFITATATDADSNTSEFSACITATGPACNYARTPASQAFAANGGSGSFSVSSINGCAWTATSNNPSWITVTASSGGGNGIVSYMVAPHSGLAPRSGTITVAGGLTFTVLQGAQFNDVPETHPFYEFIGKLSARGITLGCGGGNYCPDANVTREQGAIFIERALGVFNPPPGPMTPTFADVPNSGATDYSYEFIEDFVARGITQGCATGPPRFYCPTASVTREQMALFILRALGVFTPPAGPVMPTFADVPNSGATDYSYEFIEELYKRGITAGCQAGPPRLYCPTATVTRGQMAAFLVRAFNL
jgi:CSLREA domain-containing protein